MTSLLGLAMESIEVSDDRFAISVETMDSQKIGWFLARDQETSKALCMQGGSTSGAYGKLFAPDSLLKLN